MTGLLILGSCFSSACGEGGGPGGEDNSQTGGSGNDTSTTGGTGSGTASGGNTGGGGSAPQGSLGISNFQIEPNLRMNLGAYVSWTTEEPASSEVQFGQGQYTYAIVDESMTMEHRVHVVGMHAESTYEIKAISDSGTDRGSVEGTFTTGALPEKLDQPELLTNLPEKSQQGWTLTNFQSGDLGQSRHHRDHG